MEKPVWDKKRPKDLGKPKDLSVKKKKSAKARAKATCKTLAETVLKLADHMKKRVIGQDHGMEMIARRIQTSRASLDATHEGRMVMGRSSWCVRAAPGLVDAVTTAWPRPWLPRAGPPLPHGVRDSGVLSGPSGTGGAGWSRGDRLSSTPSDGTAP